MWKNKSAFLLIIVVGICIIIHQIYVSLYNYHGYKQRNEQAIYGSKDDILQINSIRDEWRQAFFDIFLIPNFIPLFRSNDLYTSSIEKIIENHSKDRISKENDVQRFNDLLQTTNTFFISSRNDAKLMDDKTFIVSCHRQIISIRRYIMILHQYLQSAEPNNVDSNLYSSLILYIFIPMRLKFVSTILNDAKYTKYWHLIHLSKSAGSSICQTSKDIQYVHMKREGTNCNMQYHGPPMKGEDAGIFSCEHIESIRKNDGMEFFASERPITGHKVSDKPFHCDAYLYILPVRNPFKRIASTLSEYNNKMYYPFQILTPWGNENPVYKMESKARQRRRYQCYYRFIVLRNKTYGSLRYGDDYSDFVERLFQNEDKETEVDIVYFNHFRCQDASQLDDEYKHLYRENDMTHIQWFGKEKKFAIKITEGFKDRSNISLIRGYCSNTLTRWIGFERAKESKKVYDALFAKSWNVNVSHWMNAVDFMFATDYILPFDSKFDHEIFEYALKDLWDFKPKREDKMYRRMQDRTEKIQRIERMRKVKMRRIKRREKGKLIDASSIKRVKKRFSPDVERTRIKYALNQKRANVRANRTEWRHTHMSNDGINGQSRISSGQWLQSWTQQDKDFIYQKNLLDIQLYKMAQYIADVDATFYALLPSKGSTTE